MLHFPILDIFMSMASFFVLDTSGSLSESQLTSLEKLLKEATDAAQGFSSQHKDSHGAISRIGKAIDRVRTEY